MAEGDQGRGCAREQLGRKLRAGRPASRIHTDDGLAGPPPAIYVPLPPYRLNVRPHGDASGIQHMLDVSTTEAMEMRSPRKVRRAFSLVFASALALFGSAALAQGPYPVKPVRLIVPSPPGQAKDFVARLLAEELTKIWAQQVLIDNVIEGVGHSGTGAPA